MVQSNLVPFHWPNTTSKGTALLRAVYQQDANVLIRDDYASWYVDPEVLQDFEDRPLAERIPTGPAREFVRIACLYGSLREKYFDEAIEAAIRNGCRQLLLLGAGFDTRFFRLPVLRPAEVRTVEVDRPDTIREKRSAIGRHLAEFPENLQPVGMDLSSAGLSSLFESGTCRHQPTVCVCQGLSYYLEQEDVAGLLDSFKRSLPSGSVVGFDCCTPLMLCENADIPGIEFNIQRLKEINEPFRFGMWVDDMKRWLVSMGFKAPEILSQGELAMKYHLGVNLPANMWYVVLANC